MNLDTEWKESLLAVVQFTNVALVYSPNATSCMNVRDLNISSLQTYLGITEDPVVASMERLEGRIDPYQFIWSVLGMHDATFCPHIDCNACLRRIRQMKLATCLALVRTLEDVPSSLGPTLDSGADWAFIHPQETRIHLLDPSRLQYEQSRITPGLQLSTTNNGCFDNHFDALHQWNRQRVGICPENP